MAFPDDPLCPTVELFYSSTWNDITADVIATDDVTIRHGRSDWASTPDPSQCTLILDNRDGKYSPRNPRSPLYGLIGRNTPLRLRMGDPDTAFTMPGVEGSYASTPDQPSLDITGDIDVRIDIHPGTWRPDTFEILAAKYVVPNSGQKSWVFYLTPDGAPRLGWSTDGFEATTKRVSPNAAIPLESGRLALRVTLDVDNGASGNTATFYTASTIAGPWTQLGDPVVTAGATSMFSSDSALAVGADSEGATAFTDGQTLAARVYSFEVRAGIGGTLVAAPDFSGLAVGDRTFTDSAGLLWSLNGAATVSDASIRFSGEVSSWPPRWGSELDVRTPITASGIRRRLNQGASPLSSALYRGIMGGNITPPVGYWPCEDSNDATSFASALGHEPMRILGETKAVKPAAFSGIPSTLPIPTVSTGGRFQGGIPAYPDSAYMRGMVLANIPDGGLSSEQTLLRVRTIGGDSEAWLINVTPEGWMRLICFAHGGATLVDHLTGFQLNGSSHLIWIYLEQVGADVNWQFGSANIEGGTGVTNGTLSGKTFGRAHQIVIGQNYNLNDVAVGHVMVLHTTEFWDAVAFAKAWNSDTASRRIVRLADEESVPVAVDAGAAEKVGPQRPLTFLDLADEASEADAGVLLDRRDALGLHYRPRETFYNQTPALTLDYSTGEVSAPFEPVEDDQEIRNDITVNRVDGSSAHAVLETGPLNVNPPTVDPQGVGRYEDSTDINVNTDGQLPDQAGWRLHLGTVDEARYPTITVDLFANPHLIDAVKKVKVGDRIVINNPPDWLPPDPIDLIVQGYQELLNALTWKITFNCSPGSPWNVWVLEDADYSRLDSAYSETTVPFIAGTDTALSVCSGRFEGFEDTNTLPTVSSTWERTQTDAHTGTWSLYSGVVNDSGTSDAVFTVPEGATHFRFWYRVSSESGFDFFRFLIDGVEQFNASGEVVWTQSPVFDVAVGSELTFRYAKDSSVGSGSDAAWVDDLTFTNGVLWETDPALTQVPFDIDAGGVRLRVTAITNETSPQIFTVDQVPINGVTMTIPRGASVQLATPAILAL